MARRQATKTAIPGDSTSLTPEPSTEADADSTGSKVNLGENKAQVGLKPAALKDSKPKQPGQMESAASAGKAGDQQPPSVGSREEHKIGTELPTKDSCLVETLGEASNVWICV